MIKERGPTVTTQAGIAGHLVFHAKRDCCVVEEERDYI